MRFDFFNPFWDKYQDVLIKLGLKQEIIKSVYKNNFELFRITEDGLYEDVLNSIKYVFEVKSDTDGKDIFVLRPVDKISGIFKMMYIEDNQIKILNVTERDIRIEKYNYKKESIILKYYDENTFEYLKDNNLLYNLNASSFDKQIEGAHLLPDFEVSATKQEDLLRTMAIKDNLLLQFRLEKNGEPYYFEDSDVKTLVEVPEESIYSYVNKMYI